VFGDFTESTLIPALSWTPGVATDLVHPSAGVPRDGS